MRAGYFDKSFTGRNPQLAADALSRPRESEVGDRHRLTACESMQRRLRADPHVPVAILKHGTDDIARQTFCDGYLLGRGSTGARPVDSPETLALRANPDGAVAVVDDRCTRSGRHGIRAALAVNS